MNRFTSVMAVCCLLAGIGFLGVFVSSAEAELRAGRSEAYVSGTSSSGSYFGISPDGQLTPSPQVNKILLELRKKLYDMNGAALYLRATYDRAAVIVRNLRENRTRIQVNPLKVEKLKNDLARIGEEAKQLHKDIDENVGTLHSYKTRLYNAFPRYRKTIDGYYHEMMEMRKKAERTALYVARRAPKMSREVQSLMAKGFGQYMARPGVVTARSSDSSFDLSGSGSSGDVKDHSSRIDALIAERLGKDGSGSSTGNGDSPEDDAELAAFLAGRNADESVKMPPLMVDPSEVTADTASSGSKTASSASKMPPLMVDPSEVTQANSPGREYTSKSSKIPPLMVIEEKKPVADKPPVLVKNTSKTGKPNKNSSTGKVSAQISSSTRNSEKSQKTNSKPVKSNSSVKPKEPEKTDESGDDDDDGFGGFGGFDDDEEEAAPPKKAPASSKPATKKKPPVKKPVPTKKAEPVKKTAPKKKAEPAEEEDDDFEGFMDFDEGFAPMIDRSDDVAFSGSSQGRVKLFSEQIAEEFRRNGIVDKVAAPSLKVALVAKATTEKKSFAAILKSELKDGLSDDGVFLPEDKSTMISALLELKDDDVDCHYKVQKERKKGADSSSRKKRIRELLNKLKKQI